MILGFESPVTTLNQWLKIATYDLVTPAKERIQAEIEAHYAEAVASHLAHQDVSQAEAEMAALAELGDAPAAGKKFRKQYLSESAVSRLEWRVKWVGDWPFLLCWYSLSFVFFLLLLCNKENIPIFVFQFIGFGVLPTILFRIARRQIEKPNAFWACWLAVLEPSLLMSLNFNFVLLNLSHPHEPIFKEFVICESLLFFNVCCRCLAWKQTYLRWKQIWPEEPPQGTALS